MQISSYDLFVAMEVDKKSIHGCIMNHERILSKVCFPNDGSRVLGYVEKNFPGAKVLFAYEAGPTGYGLYDYLVVRGKDCRVAVPSMIPRAPGQRVKTNRLDAERLGHQLKSGDLRYVKVPEELYRDLRSLVRLRARYGRQLMATKQRLKAVYLLEDIRFPEGRWSGRLLEQLEQHRHRCEVSFKVDQLLKDYEYNRKQEVVAIAEIRRFCRSNEELNCSMEYLMSLKGVGWIVSSYFLAAIGGGQHLVNAAKTCAFFGLGIKEHSTGDRIRRSGITAAGDPYGRKFMIQAAWVAIKKDPELKSFFSRIYSGNPKHIAKKKAIVAVSRKLVCRMHAVLKQQKFYKLAE